MSTTIDQRVVEMRFDNKQFEQNVSTTMSSIDKLKQGLNFDGAAKGLDGITDAAKKVDLSTLSGGVETIGLKFNALYTIADQALRNITNAAMNAGKKIVSALTIDPVKTGFQEYETQINAIQTILSNTKSKGTTIDDVNGALDELNTYADKTIYNFTEMTRNIGTFTAAGVDLDTSVSAIKGIANLAAVSGSTSQQASTAMYQLSQALASGTVKLMDWNSVVNAGMGGQVFQDALKETARVHGIAIDDLIKKEGSFRETLSHGWLSSEILTETLSKFTGDLNEEQLKSMGYTQEQIKSIIEMGKDANDAATKVKTFTQLFDTLKEAAQSGWTSSWEIIVGDFYEARDLFTAVSDTIGGILGDSAAARNELLENWKVLGGRQAVIDGIKYAFEGFMSMFQAVSEAAKEVFPPMTAERLVAISEKIRDIAKSFDAFFNIRGEDGKIEGRTKNFENLKRTLKGIFAVVKIVTSIFGALFKAFGKVLGVTGTLGGGLLSVTAAVGDWLVMISDAVTHTNIFESVFTGIANVIKFVIKMFAKFSNALGESFVFTAVTEGLSAFLGLIVSTGDATDRFAQMGKNVKDAWMSSGLYSFLMKVWEVIKAVGNGIKKVFSGLFGGIADAFGSGDFSSIMSVIEALLSGGLIVALGAFIKKLSDLFGAPKAIIDMFKGITETIDDVIGSVGDTFKAFQNKLKADALKSIATAILILVGAILVLTFIDESEISKALAAITILMTALTIMTKFMGSGNMSGSLSKSGLSFSRDTNALMSMGLGLLAMAGAVAILASIDTDKMWAGVLALSAMIGVLGVVQFALSKFGNSGSVKGSAWLISMGLTLLMLAASMRIIATLEWEDWAKGLIGVVALLGALAGVQILYSKLGGGAGKMLAGAVAISLIATSLNMLIPILTFFAILSLPALIKSVAMLTVLLAALGAVQILYGKLGNGWDSMLSGATAIAVMADSLNKLIPVLIIFAVMPLGASLQAIGLLTLILAALGGVQVMYGKLGGGAKSMMSGATAIAIMATSMNLLLPFLIIVGGMEWNQALQGVLALTAVLAALSGAMVMINKLGGGAVKIKAASSAILTLATAVLLLAPALVMLGSMDLAQAAIGVGTLVVALGAIVGIAAVVSKFVPSFYAFAAALQAVGIGVLAAGAGIVLFGIGLSTIALGIIELIGALTMLVGSLGTVSVGLVVLIAAVVEGVIRGIGAGIVALCQVLIEALPLIADVVVEFVGMICDVIVECAPKIVDTIFILIMEICSSMSRYVPDIVAALVRLITGIIEALASEIPGLVQAVVDLLFAFIEGVMNALGAMDSSKLMDAVSNIGMIALIMAELAAMSLLTVPAMAGVVAMGIVVAELAAVLGLLGGIARIDGLTDLISDGGNLLETVGKAIGQFIGGLVGGFAKGTTSDLPEVASNLSGFADNIGGFLDIAPKLAGVMASFAGVSIIDSIAGAFAGNKFGGSMDLISDELPKLGAGLAGFSDAIGDRDFANLNDAAIGAECLVKVIDALPRTGGLAGLFAGDKDLGSFGDNLINLGNGLASFSDTIGTRDFSNIGNAVTAAEGLVDLTKAIPDQNGLMSWITGETSIARFGSDLGKLGEGIVNFAEKVTNVPDVSAAIKVGKGLVDLINKIPNEGGVIAWFAGSSSISKFSTDLASLGTGIKGFADNVDGLNADNVSVAVTAAQGLVDLTNKIPNEGGVKSWFAGDSAISKFGNDIGDLGTGIKSFATNTEGITPETVKAAADAAITLSTIMDHVPNEGGVKSWFTGESSLSKFGDDLGSLGTGLKSFATNTEGISPETVEAAAKAAVSLAGIMDYIPNEGGVTAWFTGEKSLSKFGNDLGALGTGLKDFATNTGEMDPAKVEAAATAAEAIAKMTQSIPKSEGVISWFAGDISISKFADQLPKLGSGLAGFANNLGDAKMTNVEAASTAGKALAEMTSVIPKEGGIAAWFTGETSFAKFAEHLPALGEGIAGFANSLGSADMSKVEPAANAGKTLAQMTDTVPKDSSKIVKFGENLGKFGTGMKQFIANVSGMTDTVTAGASLVVKLAQDASTIDAGKIDAVTKAIKNLSTAVKNMEKDVKSNMKDAGKKAVEGYINGIDDNIDDAEKKAEQLVKDAAAAASKSTAFETAGENAADGYAQGIKNHQSNAVNAAVAMVAAVLTAIQEAQNSHSPSKETEKLGGFGGIGYVNGLLAYVNKSEDAGYELGDAAKNGLKDAVNRIQDFIDSDMDTTPTIRPVLDLSDVESRAGLIGSLFGNSSVGVRANLGAINSMMNARNQNGTNADVIAAIKELRDDLSNVGNTTYNIDGITYDDGSNIAEAVSTLIRAAKIERRV